MYHHNPHHVAAVVDIVEQERERIGLSKENRIDLFIAFDHYISPLQLRDMLGYIEWSRANDRKKTYRNFDILHDVYGLLKEEKFFLPRTTGYGNFLSDDFDGTLTMNETK